MSAIETALVLCAAGVLAGVVGTAGGITSLVSYPALLAVGVPALPANVANLVALVVCWPGAAVSSRAELAGTRRWLSWGLPIAAAGGALGAGLLLATSQGSFARVVPFLVAAGSAALLLQPRLTALREHRLHDGRLLTLALVAMIGIYGGYFGAGSGVMILALLLVLLDRRLPQANAVKNMVVGANTLAAAVLLVVGGPVDWTAVAPLAAGLFAGSVAGPVVAGGCRHASSAGRSRRWASRSLSSCGSIPPDEAGRRAQLIGRRVTDGGSCAAASRSTSQSVRLRPRGPAAGT